MDLATRQIRDTLQRLMIDNIRYLLSKNGEEDYLLYSFEQERQMYASRRLEVKKSIYGAIEYEPRRRRGSPAIRIDTPVGGYVADRAIIKPSEGGERRLHLVAETRSSLDPVGRRPQENDKIKCGDAHFDVVPEVKYTVATNASEV